MDVFSHIDVSIPKLQGNLGVHRAVYEYGRLGYNVLWPLCDSAKYDLVIEKDGKFQRIQVKTTRTNQEYRNTRNDGTVNKTKCLTRWTVSLATTGGNTKVNIRTVRQDGDYDVLFVLASNGKCWSIPVGDMVARNSTIICEEKHFSYEL